MVRGTRLWSVRMSVFEDQIAFSADGSTVAVLQSTDSVSVLSAATGRRLAALRSPHPLLSIALSPDGRVLATGSNRRVRFYSVPSGRLLGSDDRHAASTAMVFAPDGKRFATRTGHSILVSHFRFARP
jgi:WD40 repeat protein